MASPECDCNIGAASEVSVDDLVSDKAVRVLVELVELVELVDGPVEVVGGSSAREFTDGGVTGRAGPIKGIGELVVDPKTTR